MLKEQFTTDQTSSDQELAIQRSPASAITASICGQGSAFPKTKYSQPQVAALLGIHNRTVQKLLSAKHIVTRNLYLPSPAPGETAIAEETHEMLNQKFDDGVLDIGVRAVRKAIASSPFKNSEMEFLICVTSSGFRVPGVSSAIARALNLRSDLYRLDVVGMGCNAGMSALRTAQALAKEGKKGVLLCCEVNSAIYVRDETIRTGIVNSLFGDGAAAVVLAPTSEILSSAGPAKSPQPVRTELLSFASHTISSQFGAMRFDWNSEQKKWSFGLSKDIPFVVGDHLHLPVEKILAAEGLQKSDIKHWTLHTGGAAVIEGAKKSLSIGEDQVRHTRSVLKEHGNISSGSFLVSHERLLKENLIQDQDYGVMIAMGPGATLEACLVRYHRSI